MKKNIANTFSSMPSIPYKILTALMDNENFWKLIYYDDPDALSKPNLTAQEKRKLIWDGRIDRMDDYNIFLTNIQPNAEIESKTILKCYRYNTDPLNLVLSTLTYRIDILYGTRTAMVIYNGIPCNRGDVIEMEIMKSLNGVDVAGVGYLQYNAELTALCGSTAGIGNNSTFTGYSIIFATQNGDVRKQTC